MTNFDICVLPGDGIGPEVMAPTLELLQELTAQFDGFSLTLNDHPSGAGHYRDTGESLPRATIDAACAADAILLGAMGLPDIRYPDGTEIVPQIELRMILGLYAGIRPVRSIPGIPAPLADPRGSALDFVIIRESTEGLFAPSGRPELIGDEEARETMVITRSVSERLFAQTFQLAEQRQAAGHAGRVTCVDKANVFQALAFFRKIFTETAENHPGLTADNDYVDAVALKLIRDPWQFDVMVTENMFGDILSDQAAALVGGMGFAPSADIGDDHAVFQPCHGTAPDIAGQGKANPTAMVLSAAMMLDWLGRRHNVGDAIAAGAKLQAAVDDAFRLGNLVPTEIGGPAGTAEIINSIRSGISG